MFFGGQKPTAQFLPRLKKVTVSLMFKRAAGKALFLEQINPFTQNAAPFHSPSKSDFSNKEPTLKFSAHHRNNVTSHLLAKMVNLHTNFELKVSDSRQKKYIFFCNNQGSLSTLKTACLKVDVVKVTRVKR